MRSPQVLAAVAAAVIVGVSPATSRAGQAVSPTAAGVTRDTGPFVADTIGVEFAAVGLGELWALNGSREWLAGVSAAAWWAFADGRALIVQFHAIEVFQSLPRHAFVNGVVPSLRWRFAQGPRLDVFAEFGAGVSWSDTGVPPRGTRFNYIAETGIGVTRRVGRQTHAVAAVRLFHLSNGNREGTVRNPDIEALGGYIGLSLGF